MTEAWPREFQARDGQHYRVRPIEPGDIARERAFILGLSEKSRYQRLMYSMREPSQAFLERMVNVDYRRHMALVAMVGAGDTESFVAVARYGAGETSGDTEFAVVVADAWQGKGVGSNLARLLFEYAASQGIAELSGTIFADNASMLGLVRHLHMSIGPHAQDARLRVARIRTNPDDTQPGSAEDARSPGRGIS